MAVLNFLMTVFSYSMFYGMNCIMFPFTISSFLWNVGLSWGGREVRPELYNIRGRLAKLLTFYGEEGVKKSIFFCYIICKPPFTSAMCI